MAAGIVLLLQASRPAGIPGNWETEANLPLIPDHGRFDAVFLELPKPGFFRATRIISLWKKSWAKKSRTFRRGAGVVPMELYLSHFYKRGNRAGTVVYFLDPFIFYSRSWNEDHDCIKGEPFRMDFFVDAAAQGMSRESLIEYFQYKFSSNWRRSKGIDLRFADGNYDSLGGLTA